MKKLKIYFASLLLLALSAAGFSSEAYAAFVSPLKLYIQDGQTTTSLFITNNTDTPLVYIFEWEHRVRSRDGIEARLLNEGEVYEGYKPADPYLIYSPRKVIVEAGETQRVRILAQRPKDMPAGEYRSHLKITAEDTQPLEKPTVSAGQLGGAFSMRPAISIPVMLRTGKTAVDVQITGSKIMKENNVDVVAVNLLNSSTRSIYGSANFKCTPPGSQETSVESNGFRLYVESKAVSQNFIIPEGVTLANCGSLELELYATHEPEYDNKPIAVVKLK